MGPQAFPHNPEQACPSECGIEVACALLVRTRVAYRGRQRQLWVHCRRALLADPQGKSRADIGGIDNVSMVACVLFERRKI
jgi:hypothetical protein